MNKKYKIGFISKVFDIPVQTLRYYEQLGILNPEIDDTNNYRYYDAWELNNLLDAKYLKSLDFSNQEVAELIHNANIESYTKKFEQQEEAVFNQLCQYERLLKSIRQGRKQLETFQEHIGKFDRTRHHAIFFEAYRENNRYIDNLSRENLSCLGTWLDYLPLVKPTFIVKQESINPMNPDSIIYQWGFSANPSTAKEHGIDKFENITFYDSKPCIHTVFSADGENTFGQSLMNQVIQPILEQRHYISSDIIGNLILRTHESQMQKRYFEVWVPMID